jgi:hypothetical protein
MRQVVAVLVVCAVALTAFGQEMFVRQYREGEKLTYVMKGTNEGQQYEARATGVVKRDSAGHYVEEYEWSPVPVGGSPVLQTVSLDRNVVPTVPNLAQVPSALIGPVTDLLTFYSDQWLIIREGKLAKAGDRFRQTEVPIASWADGNFVIFGQDAINFDVELASLDTSSKVATVVVHHVPPARSPLKMPASWMAERVSDTENNWAEVVRKGAGYVAAFGKETFDVQMKIELRDGKILCGTLDNVVTAMERDCTDAALVSCSVPHSHTINRHIEIALERQVHDPVS